LALSQLFGERVAAFHNYECLLQHEVVARMYSIALEAVGKISPFVIIGLFFVPQWHRPPEPGVNIKEADCSDLITYQLIGQSALPCLARRLSTERRREIFRLMLKGPFVVAPFISILVKVIIPLVARQLNSFADATMICCRCCDAVIEGIARILSLIFAYDGDSVGCFRFVFQGNPFRKVEQSDGDKLDLALQQVLLKPSNAEDELLEVKLSFLFVMSFAPVMPWGVFPTLLAWLLETQTDLTKLLYARRRVFPRPGRTLKLHSTQREFIVGACCFYVAWALALIFVTYNDEIWQLSFRPRWV